MLTTPVAAKTNGFKSRSLDAMEIEPLQKPALVVSSCTVKVSDAPGASVDGKPSEPVPTDGANPWDNL